MREEKYRCRRCEYEFPCDDTNKERYKIGTLFCPSCHTGGDHIGKVVYYSGEELPKYINPKNLERRVAEQ